MSRFGVSRPFHEYICGIRDIGRLVAFPHWSLFYCNYVAYMGSADLPLLAPAGSAFDLLAWDARGLVPVVAVDQVTGVVIMAAHANRCALAETLRSGWATYWSRSRDTLWVKGATSGNRQRIIAVRADCDGDHLLYLVEADGPACHTGRLSCFSWRIDGDASIVCDRQVLIGSDVESSTVASAANGGRP